MPAPAQVTLGALNDINVTADNPRVGRVTVGPRISAPAHPDGTNPGDYQR
jgi:hypothetical protein